MEEIWKDIEGFEKLYEVSNLGRVRSLDRFVKKNNNSTRFIKGGVLKPCKNKGGYLIINLCKNGKTKTYNIHRLVALSFIENPKKLPCINHKNELKFDNRAKNLEWCDRSYNTNYGKRNEKVSEKLSKPIFGISKENGAWYYFDSIIGAERELNINNQNISSCCKGKSIS